MYPVREKIMWYTYILQSKRHNKWYTGCTHGLRERFISHNKGMVLSTKGRGPFIVLYYEACLNKGDASL